MIEIRRRLRIFIVLFISITISGTIGFMVLEEVPFLDALYYNIVTMSTVGYGDIHPTHLSTRLLAMFIIVFGGGTFIGFVANASEMILLQRDVKQRMRKQNIVLGIFFSEMGYHLSGDINRIYAFLVEEWLLYLIHLKKHYPYLYSLAARKNPFNPNASVVISGSP